MDGTTGAVASTALGRHREAVTVVPANGCEHRLAVDLPRVLHWLDDYVGKPSPRIGRPGMICPFVPAALTGGKIRFHFHYGVDGRDRERLEGLVTDELRRFRGRVRPPRGTAVPVLNSVIVALPDADEAGWAQIDRSYRRLKDTAVASGLMIAQFHPACPVPAVRNSSFQVSRAPIALFAVRCMAPHDVLFLHDERHWFTAYHERYAAQFEQGLVRDPLLRDRYHDALRRFQLAPDGTAVYRIDDEVLRRAGEMRRLLYGHLLSRALYALAALGIPDLLAAGPRTAADLARAADARPAELSRLLRALARFGVLDEVPGGGFRLTALGATLRADTPGSALPTALLVGREVGQAWDDLLTTVRTGQPAFPAVHGLDFFDYLERHPPVRDVFDRSQAADLAIEVDSILGVVDFGGFRTIVDVGGGDGALLERVLTAWPHLRGVLMDLPPVIAAARRRFAAADGVGDRCTFQAGDMFVTVPAGGDCYLMRQILHDWDAERCVRVLRNCRAAMPGTGRLLIVERVADEAPGTDPVGQLTALMDLYMLAVLGGRERTADEFRQLLHDGGFRLETVHRLAGGVTVLVAAPADDREGPPSHGQP
jgi:hypothetical protein